MILEFTGDGAIQLTGHVVMTSLSCTILIHAVWPVFVMTSYSEN